ncbi:flagellar biosynthesis protein FlhF [Neobacillus sp. SM06]|uniref:flagellar biosynthesis protein FlhF n=1 Tax=Neobacillus sp. SM06 TaxID=3422492 RepID=UPI003D2B10E8
MKVKKFTAESMAEAMKMVRNDLGNEAVILNSRMVFQGGFFGFFRKKNVEVIAAVDPQVGPNVMPVYKEKPKKALTSVSQNGQLDGRKGGKQKDSPPSGIPSDELLKEILSVKNLLKQSTLDGSGAVSAYPQPIQKLVRLMNEQEFSASLIEKFTAELLDQWFKRTEQSPEQEMRAYLKRGIQEFLFLVPFGGITFTKKFVNVIGPTGVGKTTTLAKIAADCVLNHQKKVAFITTDTYRIAAIEQLKTYAQILNVPIEVCYNLADFQQAAAKFADYDVILIDTAGRNFRNKKYVEDLVQVIDFNHEMETFLVLALTAKQKDMEEIYEQFSGITIDRFIFTKADETSIYGSILNMIEKYKIGAAYVTTGQNVPDDMVIASPETITNLFLGVK